MVETRKKLGRSLSLQIVFEFLKKVALLELQRLNKRYYNSMVIGLIREIVLYRSTSFMCRIHTDSIQVLSPALLKWNEVHVWEEGDTQTAKER